MYPINTTFPITRPVCCLPLSLSDHDCLRLPHGQQSCRAMQPVTTALQTTDPVYKEVFATQQLQRWYVRWKPMFVLTAAVPVYQTTFSYVHTYVKHSELRYMGIIPLVPSLYQFDNHRTSILFCLGGIGFSMLLCCVQRSFRFWLVG